MRLLVWSIGKILIATCLYQGDVRGQKNPTFPIQVHVCGEEREPSNMNYVLWFHLSRSLLGYLQVCKWFLRFHRNTQSPYSLMLLYHWPPGCTSKCYSAPPCHQGACLTLKFYLLLRWPSACWLDLSLQGSIVAVHHVSLTICVLFLLILLSSHGPMKTVFGVWKKLLAREYVKRISERSHWKSQITLLYCEDIQEKDKSSIIGDRAYRSHTNWSFLGITPSLPNISPSLQIATSECTFFLSFFLSQNLMCSRLCSQEDLELLIIWPPPPSVGLESYANTFHCWELNLTVHANLHSTNWSTFLPPDWPFWILKWNCWYYRITEIFTWRLCLPTKRFSHDTNW